VLLLTGDDRWARIAGDSDPYEGRRWLMVVDGRGRVRWPFKDWPDPAWAGWHVPVLTSRAVSPAHLAWPGIERIPYLVVGDGPVDRTLRLSAPDHRSAEAVVGAGRRSQNPDSRSSRRCDSTGRREDVRIGAQSGR